MSAYLNALRAEGTREDLLAQVARLIEERDSTAAAHAARVAELLEANNREVERRRIAERALDASSFQQRVGHWMQACFGPAISADRLERGDRLLEEVLELLQSVGYPPARVVELLAYVWDRPEGDPSQEVGGVKVTLAAFCDAHDIDMHTAGETELARIWTKVEQIRAKQAAKPTGSALPQAYRTALGDVFAERRRQISAEGWTPGHDDKHTDGSLALAAACYAEGPSGRSRVEAYSFDISGPRADHSVWETRKALVPQLWPRSWHPTWWKPSPDRRRDLVKAGALILAEIERMDRACTSIASLPAEPEGEDAWLIYFHDPDVRPEIFMGSGAEAAAMAMWEQAQINWTCDLFRSVRRDTMFTTQPTAPKPAEVRETTARYLAGLFGEEVAPRHREWADELLGRILSPAPAAEEFRPTHRHVKRGSEYRVIGEAEAQVSTGDYRPDWIVERRIADGDRLTVYQGAGGKLWCRFSDEFNDGRFAPLKNGEG